MRAIRRLPPLLRAVYGWGFLYILVSLALSTVLLFHIQPFSTLSEADTRRIQLISMGMGVLGLIDIIVVMTYNTRFHQPNRRSFPFDSWQRQALAIVLTSALPLCGLALAIVISPATKAYNFAFGISILGALALLVGMFVMIIRGQLAGS